ncbi:MAG: hypothetical protein JNL11_02415 [Bdellovibrionaceae bacterium]|nr:hypothetical protein [Pseudobdellovibrionaceae bacterium]
MKSNNNKHLTASILLVLSGVFLLGCNPSKFQVQTSNLDQRPNTTSATPVTPGNTTPADSSASKLSCVLSSDKTKVVVGEDVKFSFNANFEIPKNAQMIWTGKSFGIDITTPPERSKFFLDYGLLYQSGVQAGVHKRQIKLVDSTGNLICSSSLLKVEFIGEIQADQVCNQIGGQLGGEDNEVCSTEAWRFYREMLSRNIVSTSGIQTGNNFGMANPAAVYCSGLGGKHEITSGTCSLDKYRLQGLLNGTISGPSISGKPLLGKDITALNFSYSSGTVSPSYQYSVGYKLDFLRRSVQVSVTKGSSVFVALPTPGVRSLTDNQIANIKSLLGSMSASSCDGQVPPLGGGVSSFAIYTSATYNLDSYVWVNNCQPFSEVQNQYKSSAADSQQLMDFLKSL